MTDTELADKIVALGVGMYQPESTGCYESYVADAMDDPDLDGMDAEKFVRDWRVAGALMEKCEANCVDWEDLEPGHWRNMNHTANTPRAIIGACVESLENI